MPCPGKRWQPSRMSQSSPIKVAPKFGTAAAQTPHDWRGHKANIRVPRTPIWRLGCRNRGCSSASISRTTQHAVTDTGTAAGWGRAGLASAADWDTVIKIRQDAIYNVGFAGFLAYNWGGNGMGVTQAEQIQHEYYYRSRLVLPGQKPQWLSDSAINVNGTTIPLSWNQPLNWLGGVPNATGAEANFWRTLTANRTITLDGSKTVGKLSFDSPYSYTINAGSAAV